MKMNWLHGILYAAKRALSMARRVRAILLSSTVNASEQTEEASSDQWPRIVWPQAST